VASLEYLRFLVVDDNQYMRAIVCELLRAFGAQHVMEAENGEEAIRKGQFWQPDIIISDYAMKLDGVSFTRRIRLGETKIDPAIPIILMTGHTEATRVAAARDAGITEFLAKPLSAESLFSRIAAVIDRPREFARSTDYYGPDRRRRGDENFSGFRRRSGDDPGEDFDLDDTWSPPAGNAGKATG
jgi:CheY-like chemotaxis protein